MSSTHSQNVLSSLEELARSFDDLAGFIGVAVYSPENELIVSHSPFGLTIEQAGPGLNKLFSGAVDVLGELDLTPPRLLHLESEETNLLVYSYNECVDPGRSQEDALCFRSVLMLEAAGSIGMAKLRMKKFVRAAAMLLHEN